MPKTAQIWLCSNKITIFTPFIWYRFLLEQNVFGSKWHTFHTHFTFEMHKFAKWFFLFILKTKKTLEFCVKTMHCLVENYQYFTNKHTNVQHLQHDLHFHAKLNRSQTFTIHCWCSKVILSSKPHTKHNNLQTLHKCFFKLCRLNNFVLKLHIVGAAKTWNTHILNICN